MQSEKSSKKFFKIFIIYFIILVAFIGVRIASNFGVFEAIKNEILQDAVATIIIQIVILFLLPFTLYMLFFKKKPKKVFEEFGYKKLSAKAILICFGLGILAYILNIFVSSFFSIIIHYAGYNPQSYATSTSTQYTVPMLIYNIVSVAVLPALCEEFVHRGLVLRGTSKIIGYKRAIVLSSILFGLVHLNVQQVFYATILGLLMGLVATMTRSIWPAVIMHFCNNFINVFMSFAESNKLFGFTISSVLNNIANQSLVLFFFVSIIVVSLVLIGIFALLKKLFAETGANSYNKMFENIENKIRATNSMPMTDAEVVMAFERYIFPNMRTPTNIYDLFINDNKHYGSLKLKYKIPVVSCLVLAGLVTVFTFIWGVV